MELNPGRGHGKLVKHTLPTKINPHMAKLRFLLSFLVTLCLAFLITLCHQNQNMKKKLLAQEIKIADTVDDIEPPPPKLQQSFKNLQDWLTSICDYERPSRPIAFYATGLFESPDECVIFLLGMNKYGNHEKVDFKPKNMYYLIPKVEYKDLDRAQLDEKLIGQLRNFTQTSNFTNSYLAQADCILFRGKTVIWSKSH
jgi:hypothetical protein